jgi:CspA family cold shock protein
MAVDPSVNPKLVTTATGTGTVKMFDAKRGFGMVTPATGGRDLFVHIKTVQAANMVESMNEGTAVSYTVSTRGRYNEITEIAHS